MKRLPFRRRLTLWSTLVAAVSIFVCGVVAVWFVHRRAVAEIDAELRDESGHFFSELERHGGAEFDWKRIDHSMSEWLPRQTPPRYMQVRTGDIVRWRSDNLRAAGFAAQPPGLREVQLGGEGLRLLTAQQGGVTFAIAADLAEANSLARGLVLALLAGLPLALAFTWFGGCRLAGIAVAPVEEMTAAIEGVTAEHLDRRVPVPDQADEIQHHARALNATLDRLERSYAQALRFSADASHELKTPLTVLRSSIEAVLDSPALGDNDRAAISALLEQTQRLSSITSSLLLLSRADAGGLRLELARQNLVPLTEACVEDARIVAERRHVQVEAALPESAPAHVDALRFSQIVSNLLDNAVKYNRVDGEVRVTLAAAGSVWRLSVANTGPGIAPEHQPRLFERFFRAEHTAEESGHGLGLGLARELARAQGGDVELVRSDRDRTEFSLTLPKNGADEPIRPLSPNP